MNYIVTILLLILSGLFSGLTLGLMGLDLFELKRKIKLGNKFAKKIYPLRRKGNQLLCTLLIGNVAVNSTLAVFLGTITSGIIAGIVATFLIVIIGEIIPQAVFSRFALKFGAKTIWIVEIFYYVLYPIAKPISFILDKMLGKELQTIYSKKELKLLVSDLKNNENSDIQGTDFKILKGGLELSDITVKDVMTPRINTYMLKEDSKLTKEIIQEIIKKGHSRIPIYNETKDDCSGLIYVKDLIFELLNKKNIEAKELMRNHLSSVNLDDKLDKILQMFKRKREHLFIVKDEFNQFVGIITLEDVLEELVGEIVDEFDQVVDMRKL